ncbi:hypothetical protein ABEW05_008487 [Botrytis cinerea]
MCLVPLSGLILAIGHHVYYSSLNGTPADDSARQNWSIRFGAVFASLVVVCFKAITVSALGQYFWTVIRAKGLKISDLDKLYALTSSPIGIFSFSVFKNTTLAAAIGIIFWCMDMVSFASTATLSVIATNITIEIPIQVLDSSQFDWKNSVYMDYPNQIAIKSASLADFVPLNIPITRQEWTYDMQLLGPTFKCRAASSSGQASFDQLTDQLQRKESVYIAKHINDPPSNNLETRSLLLLNSAFQPTQLNSNCFICALMETSINITIASVNGQQRVIQNSIKYLSTILSYSGTSQPPRIARFLDNDDWSMYSSHFLTFASTIFGSILIHQAQPNHWLPSAPADEYMMTNITNDSPSFKLLSSCDDIQTSPSKYHLYSDNNETVNVGSFESQFPKDPWQCRNRTLTRAIEDLSINITNRLSQPHQQPHRIPKHHHSPPNTRNIYIYHPLYLILSHDIGSLLASLAALIRLYPIYTNGVSHSNSFPAIVLTTPNADLDVLARGKSSASAALPEECQKLKMEIGTAGVKAGV